jgi:arylsulfatase A-like enzyme
MVPEEYLEPYQGCTVQDLLRNPNVDHGRAPQAGESVKGYFGAISGIDDQVGRLLRCLRDEGLEEDTLVVFASDHGEMMGSHGRMQKSIWHQESMGVPFLLRQPGKIPVGKRCDVLLGMPDVMPTILGLLGLGSHVPGSVEGSDFSPAILGKDQARPDALLYMNAVPELRAVVEWVEAGTPQSSMYEAATLAALRNDPDDTSKLIALLSQNPIGSRGVRSRTHTYVVTRVPGQPEEHGLYNNATDPSELINCHDDEQDAAEHHRNLLRELLERTNDPWARVPSRTLSC